MDQFSCRNCIHNPAQGLSVGPGPGYCTLWRAQVPSPELATCKYASRKDLPTFLVREAMAEHAESLSGTSGIVLLEDGKTAPSEGYEAPELEGVAFEVRRLATDREEPTPDDRWRVAQLFGGSRDGQRILAHACLVRCLLVPEAPTRRWVSAGQSILEGMAEAPVFAVRQLALRPGEQPAEVADAARWEVVHACLSTLQEVGWYTGLEELKYPISTLGDAGGADFEVFFSALSARRQRFEEALLAWDVGQHLKSWSRPGPHRDGAEPRFRGLSDMLPRVGAPGRLRRVVS